MTLRQVTASCYVSPPSPKVLLQSPGDEHQSLHPVTMAPKALQGSTLKGNASATALKAAATATLADTGGYLGGNTTMKLSQGLANKTMLPKKNVTMLKSIDTVWDEEPDDQKMYEQRKKLKSLAVRVDRMAGVFDEETRARQEQRSLMDDLHNEQMKRIDEIGEELDQAMAELAAYIVEFMRRFRKQLHDTFTALFSDLQEQVERLRPRLAALEARGRVLEDGIQEEKKERMKQYSEILDPVKVQIAKLEQGLIREQQIRQETEGKVGLATCMAIPTQQQMCEHFIPILKDKGVRITKKGLRLARPARPGEEVLTIVNGEVLTRIRADVPGSMIIRQESADHEEKFAKNYHTEGIDITEAGPSFDQLRHRNFKYYRRKGELLLYQVGQKDMDFVPSGRFEVVFSSTPVSLKAGDFLVTSYPELSEIWVSRVAQPPVPTATIEFRK
eukprot:s1920_g2.t1